MTRNVWVVHLYADYRKETDSTVLKVFADEPSAIAFADGFSERAKDSPMIENDNEYICRCPGSSYDLRVTCKEDHPPVEELLNTRRPSWGISYARISITRVPFE